MRKYFYKKYPNESLCYIKFCECLIIFETVGAFGITVFHVVPKIYIRKSFVCKTLCFILVCLKVLSVSQNQ